MASHAIHAPSARSPHPSLPPISPAPLLPPGRFWSIILFIQSHHAPTSSNNLVHRWITFLEILSLTCPPRRPFPPPVSPQFPRLRALEGQLQQQQGVRQALHPEAHGPVPQVGDPRLWHRVVVPVDDLPGSLSKPEHNAGRVRFWFFLGGAVFSKPRVVGNGIHFCDTKRASHRLNPPSYRGGDSLVSQKWGKSPCSHNPDQTHVAQN